MKYYTVYVYDVKYTGDYDGQAIEIEPIIVKKGLRTATELLTNQKIEIIPEKAADKYCVIDKRYRNEEKAEKTGYHLVLLEKDFTEDNLTTEKDIDQYVEEFDYSSYKEIYDSINAKTQGEQKEQTLRQKIKAVRGTKK